MIRFPVTTQDIVRTQAVVPDQIESILERYTVDPVFNAVTWLGPGPNETWEIESAQIEGYHDGTAGQRDYWIYLMDRWGETMRYKASNAIAVYAVTFMATPGASFTTPYNDGATVTNSGPLHARRLDHPAKIGMLKSRFEGPADVTHFHVMVRSRRQL